jgi:hypothetical protein
MSGEQRLNVEVEDLESRKRVEDFRGDRKGRC